MLPIALDLMLPISLASDPSPSISTRNILLPSHCYRVTWPRPRHPHPLPRPHSRASCNRTLAHKSFLLYRAEPSAHNQLLLLLSWDFPRGPVVKTLHFHCRGTGSIPGQGTKILHATQCGQKPPKPPSPKNDFSRWKERWWRRRTCTHSLLREHHHHN